MERMYHVLDMIDQIYDEYSGVDFLCTLQDVYEASNVIYVGLNLPSPTHGKYCILHTCSLDWERGYVEDGLIETDPALKAGLSRITPADWSSLRDRSDAERKFFDKIRRLGVGRQGLTFPLRGPCGEMAVFTINTNHDDENWLHYKRKVMADLQVLATYFHEKLIHTQRQTRPGIESLLSRRELECLKWCAAGKSYWETAVILGISERTVNHHMTTVRKKMEALTNAQAVAKALSFGLPSPA